MKTSKPSVPVRISFYTALFVALSITAAAQQPNMPATGGASQPALTTFPDLANYTAPSSARNFVRTFVPAKPTTDPAVINITGAAQTAQPCITATHYFDGLGRPLQNVMRSGSGHALNGDLVTVYTYDALGRESHAYLPYFGNDQYSADHGKLKTDPLNGLSAQYQSIYPGQHPYAKTDYDGSPLNRVTKTYAPGASWVGAGRGKEYTYRTNTAEDAVRIWTIGPHATDYPQTAAVYNAGALSVTEGMDEDGHKSLEYKDKQGRTILKKSFLLAIHNGGPHMQYACTYYIYDGLSRLRYIISPKAVHAIHQSWDVSQVPSLCYRYVYDQRGRMTEKQLPDKEAEYMVYDNHDRLVLHQDGNMRRDGNKWAFTAYDALGRPVAGGRYTAPGGATRQSLEAAVGTGTGSYSTSSVLYYLDHTDLFETYPAAMLSDGEVHTYSYYDNYSQLPGAVFNGTFNSQLTGNAAYAIQPSPSSRSNGLVTGTRVRVLDPNNTNLWIKTVNFYDEQGRLIQQQADNILGGVDVTTNQYDFQGSLASSVLHHTNPNAAAPYTTTDIVKRYTKNYLTGAITKEEQNINGTGFRTISHTTFDALGRVHAKALGTIFTNTYSYNIRSWLTGINQSGIEDYSSGQFFHERISYDQGFSAPQYNGNISGIEWRGYGNRSPRRYYGYSYDKQERLSGAEFGEWHPGGGGWNKTRNDYSVSGLYYDANGNIGEMTQRGPGLVSGAAAPVDMDVLSYSYASNSNRLLRVTDNNSSAQTTAPDFRDGNTNGDDYDYDGNGNLTIDRNKDITTPVTYSWHNKPVTIEVNNKGTLVYLYDALGNKLRKTTIEQSGTKITDYCGPVIYENNRLQSILHSEGRCRPDPAATTSAAYLYDYFMKDHLGNVRTVVHAKETNGLQEYVYATGLEVAHAHAERLLWTHLDDVRTDKPSPVTGDFKAALLDGTDPDRRIGTAIMLKVMPGDKFRVSADSWYETVDNEAPVSSPDMAGSLISALAGGSLYGGGAVSEIDQHVQLIQQGFGNSNFISSYDQLINQSYDPQLPGAFLNYVLMDEQMRVMPGSGVLQASGAGSSWNPNETAQDIEVGTAGYLTVWTSNRGAGPVYFDKVLLKHYKGQVLEEDHYYPFGLTLSTNSANPAEQNKIKFQTQRLESDLGLNWYDYKYRMHDMQIGRFTTIDPLSESFVHNSVYAFSENKVTAHVELEGLEAFPINNAFNTIGNGTAWNHVLNNPASQQSLGSQIFKSNHFGALGALTAGSLTAAGMGGYLAAPAAITWTLGNPIAANEIFAGGLALATGYPGELPTAGSGKGFSKMVDELSSNGGKIMEETGAFLRGFDAHLGKVSIGLGLDADLALHRGTGIITYKNAGWQKAGLTSVDWGRASMDNYYFKESFKEAADNAGSIKFDVTNFNPFHPKPGMTNFEFNHVTSNPSLFQKTNFIQNGSRVNWDGKNFLKVGQ
jgi:RHS repeat-associated protein